MSAMCLVLCAVVPGLAAARFVHGARRVPELLWLSVLSSLLVFTPLVYPASLLARAPTTAAIVIPLALFTLACVRVRRPVLAGAFWTATPPSGALWLFCGAWATLAAYTGTKIRDWACSGTVDVAYFHGLLRALRTETPAHNPELAAAYLTHSSGYWFWYACLQRLTGQSTQKTLFILGALVGVVLLVSIHRLSHLLWADGVAAMATVVFLWIPSEPVWPLLLSHHTFQSPHHIRSFNDSLVIAWYNGPPLVLLLLTLGTLAWLVQYPRSATPLVVLLLLLVLFPFHHAMYYGMALCGFAPYLAWAVAKGRLPRQALLCLVTWLPWKALAWAWPEVMLAGDPRFDVGLDDIAPDLLLTLQRHALLLPLALLGARRTGAAGKGALLSMLGVLLLPGPWAGPVNRHWQWDPLALCLALLAGAAAGRLCRREHGKWLGVLAALWLAPNVALAGKRTYGLLAPEPAASRCAGPPGLREAATWLRDNTPLDARVATPPGSIEGEYVEVYGERPLVFGDAIHFDMADPAPLWRPVEAATARLFQSQDPEEIGAILRRQRVGYVLFTCLGDGSCPGPRGVGSLLPVVFRAERVVVLRVPPPT